MHFGHIYGYISLSMWFLMQSLQMVVEMESLGVFYKISVEMNFAHFTQLVQECHLFVLEAP